MNRYFSVAAAITCMMLGTGCARHLTDFTVISTKNNMLADDSVRGERVSGAACVPVILLQWGEPDLTAAIDKTIESAGPEYDALVDGVVYHSYESFFFGQNCLRVEGTPVSRQATAAR